MNIVRSILYPPPESLFMNTMSVVSLLLLINAGISEVRDRNLPFSKFWHCEAKTRSARMNRSNAGCGTLQLSGRTGMFLGYSPTLVVTLASFFMPGIMAVPRGKLLSAALSVHFFKRVMEVLFIHQYSGYMMLETALGITFNYLVIIVCMIYSQHLSCDMPEPAVDLRYAGILLFLIGITGNFYHHYILSKLREKGNKDYKIPSSGLFHLVICPHYLFEIIGFLGIALISQNIYPFCFTFGSMFYLMGRSYSTRIWYMSKFKNFSTGIKVLLPYIF